MPERASGRDSGSGVAPAGLALLVFEGERPLAPIADIPLRGVTEVAVGRAGDRERRYHHDDAGRVELSIPDSRLSRNHLRIYRDAAGWRVCDLGSRNGTLVNGVAATHALLCPGDAVFAGRTVLLLHHARPSVPTGDPGNAPRAFATGNAALGVTFDALRRLAPSSVAVLIHGPTGTGKELTARAIHDLSGRAGAFVAVNCGALPRALIESELFGYKKGAFSGALDDKLGLVRSADRGTLFLDEIAELPASAQAALLRVLQEWEVRPIGGTTSHRVDVRVVSATHQDLPAKVADGSFRQDLYARLAGYTAELPALRDRREDIGPLTATLLAEIAGGAPVRLTQAAACALFCYAFPMNVRELEHALRTAFTLSDDGDLDLRHFPPAIRQAVGCDELSPADRALRDRIVVLVHEHAGNVAAVARAMGKAPMQIRRWCKRFGIDVQRARRATAAH